MATYCLVLTKGTHLVDDDARNRVLAALEHGERIVDIAVDRYQDGRSEPATIVTSHVVAFFPHEDLEEVELPANVTALVRRN